MAIKIKKEELQELEIDEMEKEIAEATQEKKTRKVVLTANQIGVAQLAEMLETTGRDLRIFLRKNFRDMESDKGKTYVWEKGSEELQNIIDTYKAHKAAPRKKAEKVDIANSMIGSTPPISLDDIDLDDME